MSSTRSTLAVRTLPPCESPLMYFTGSEQVLEEIHQKIKRTNERGKHAMERLTILTGLGGIGKSSMARKYAQVYRDYHGGNIAWIDATTEESIVSSFISLARHLNICTDIINSFKPEEHIQSIVQQVYNHFSDYIKKGLFIINNAHRMRTRTDRPSIKDYLPKNELTHYPLFLITSRITDWGRPEQMIHLGSWTKELSLEFLLKALKIEGSCKDQLKECVSQLVVLFGGYPLALNLAVGNIKSNLTYKIKDPENPQDALYQVIGDYIVGFQNSEKWLKAPFPSTYYDPYNLTMENVWESSIKSIRNHQEQPRAELAIKLLYIMSFLPNECITVELLHLIEYDMLIHNDNYHQHDFHDDIKGVDAALSLLDQHSMIHIPIVGNHKPRRTIWIHHLVQKWARSQYKLERNSNVIQQLQHFVAKNSGSLEKNMIDSIEIYSRILDSSFEDHENYDGPHADPYDGHVDFDVNQATPDGHKSNSLGFRVTSLIPFPSSASGADGSLSKMDGSSCQLLLSISVSETSPTKSDSPIRQMRIRRSQIFNMNLAEWLKLYPFSKFLDEHKAYLHDYTVSLQTLATCAGLDPNELQEMRARLNAVEQAVYLYANLRRRNNPSQFIEALGSSSNHNILEYIKEQMNLFYSNKQSEILVVPTTPTNPILLATSEEESNLKAKNLESKRQQLKLMTNEIIQPMKLDLCQKSVNHQLFSTYLESVGKLMANQKQEFESLNSDFQRWDSTYHLVGQMDCFKELVEGLLKSGNGHIVIMLENRLEALSHRNKH